MNQWIAFKTIVRREIIRFFRIWTQTIIPSVVTTLLYFIIFGNLIGSRINDLNGVRYIEYITPGLIMMPVITNAFQNVAGSFFTLRFQKCVEELLVAPVANWIILLGFVIGGTLRGILIGLIVTMIASFYTTIHIKHFGLFFTIIILTALLFSLAGFLNAIFAKRFDDIAFIPTFILTPLIYLGGVFYSLTLLSPFWQKVSFINPILYLVNTFRYSMLNITDVSIYIAFVIVITTSVALWFLNLRLMKVKLLS